MILNSRFMTVECHGHLSILPKMLIILWHNCGAMLLISLGLLTPRIQSRQSQSVELVKADRSVDKVLIGSFLQHFLGGTLQKTHRRIRSTWAKAHASNAERLQIADRRQPLPNHDIDGKIKLLHKATYRTRLSQTHRIDAISPRVSVGSGTANSLFELSLIIAGSKSQRIGSSIDHERYPHNLTKSPDRFDVLDLSLSGKELLRCMSEVFDVYSDSSRFQNCLDCGHHFSSGLSFYRYGVHREWDRQDPSDSFDSRHEFRTTHHLAIRVAERYHQSGARCCNRWESFILKDACTWDVPCVRKN